MIRKGVVLAVMLLFVGIIITPFCIVNTIEGTEWVLLSVDENISHSFIFISNRSPKTLNITGPRYGKPGVNYTFCIEYVTLMKILYTVCGTGAMGPTLDGLAHMFLVR